MKRFFLFSAVLVLSLSFGGLSLAADHLDNRRAAIIPIAAFTASGTTDALAKSLENGLDSGLSINDIKEVLIQMYAYCGFPRSLTGLNTFMSVLENRKKNGKEDTQGELPSALPANAKRDEIGSAIQTALLGRPANAPVYQFAPAIDQFLKEHLFCDIFSRGVLTDQERELATVAALATLPAESQLRSHLNFSLNTGLTPDQLNDFVIILTEKVGEKPGNLAKKILAEVVASRPVR